MAIQPSDKPNDIESLSRIKEGHYFDRKSARIKLKDLAKTVVAFANAAGGRIAIGFENDGSVTGFKQSGALSVEEFEQINILECIPSPMIAAVRLSAKNVRGEDDEVLLLDIAPSPNTVIRRKSDNAVFLRQGDKSIQLDDQGIRALEYDKNQRVFEDEIVKDSSIEDIDHEILNRYKNALGTDLPDEQVLSSRGFLREGKLTKAGILLFSEFPGKYLPQARVRVLRFEGTEMGAGKEFNVVKDVSFDGPIPKIIDEVSSLVRSMLREFQYLGDDGRFQVIPEYPEFAWFEGLVNAVTHRDYAYSGDYIRISMYDDRLEVISPGKLPNAITLDNMRFKRYSRNPRIARALAELGWVRELNEGVKRIYSEMQRMFLNDPVFSEPDNSAVLMILNNSITSRVLRRSDAVAGEIGEDAYRDLNEYELDAVQYLYGKGRLTVNELAKHLGRSSNVARNTLKSLAAKHIIVWHGTSQNDPSQYYTLAQQSKVE